MAAAGTITDTNGAYSFSGLRAGSYTVEMSNWNEASYDFGTTSASVSLATGASEIVAFEGSLVTTASISGSLFIDEFSKDSILNTGLEDNITIANVPVTLKGILVLDTMTVLTDATDSFTFPDLAEGSYRITVASMALVPGMVGFSGVNPQTTTVASGEAGTINFPFSILTQTINVSGYLGVDATNPGVTPITGWTINLYDTQLNAAAGTATGRLGTTATTAAGLSTFRFLRTAAVSPNAATTDKIVFAQVAGAPGGLYSTSGEAIIEIPYAGTDSSSMAPDTFDALYSTVTVAFNGQEIDGDPLGGWTALLRANKDTTAAVSMSGPLDAAAGWFYWMLSPAALAGTTDGALPDTIYSRLQNTQANANGHGFTQVPTGQEGTTSGGQVKFIWDGTKGPNDTIWMGTSTVTYTDVDVLVGIHQEKDDSTDVATYTAGDAVGSVAGASVLQLYNNTTGTPASHGAAAAPGSGGAPYQVNELLFTNLAVDSTWQARARSTNVNLDVLNDSTFDFTLEGDDQIDWVGALIGSAGPSWFAMKANNTTISGTILSVDGVTPVGTMRVTVSATSDNIQPNRTDTTVVTSAGGAYTLTGLREGPYTVTVQDSSGVWSFTDTLTKVTQNGNVAADAAIPAAGVEKAGTAVVNTDAFSGTRDVEGFGSTSTVMFAANRLDTKIEGVVVNDCDSDFNTLDPNEALGGVVVTLYDDADADGTVDTGEAIVVVDTTDATGAYAFSALIEDNYIVSAASLKSNTVLRALSATGTVTNTVAALTTAVTGAGATLNQNGTKQVGDVDPPSQSDEFPRWSYTLGTAAADGGHLGAGAGPNFLNVGAGALTTSPTNFVHLFNTGTVQGTVKAGTTGVAGVTVTITRCQTAATAPAPGACTLKHGTPSPHIANVDTDASGGYSFTTLLEGVYPVDVAPVTAGYTTITTPAGGVYRATLTEKNDIETVPDFIIA